MYEGIIRATTIPYKSFTDMIRITRYYEDKGFDTELWEDLGKVYITGRNKNDKRTKRRY